MGSGLSRHDDEIRDEQQLRSAADAARFSPGDSNTTTEAAATLLNGTTTTTTDHVNSGAGGGGGGGGCPMKQTDGSYSFDWMALLRPEFPHGPLGGQPLSEDEARAKVSSSSTETNNSSSIADNTGKVTTGAYNKPHHDNHPEYNVYSEPIDRSNNMPQVANQVPGPYQSKPLSTERVVSSIPKGGGNVSEGTTWTYPSPQMFYNALARKGKLGTDDPTTTTTIPTTEDDMELVVALHNHMNEKTWRKVLQWEQVMAPYQSQEQSPKLLRFQGRPKDLSPKAWWKHYIVGHPLPFDRHDWIVVRHDGTTVRYVIDYYYDESRASDQPVSAMPHPMLAEADATPSLLVDVRPALDTPEQLWGRTIAMPLAQYRQMTQYQGLPLRPTAEMKSQVSESVQVWNNIQRSIHKDKAHPQPTNELTGPQAQALAESFARIAKDCKLEQSAVDRCQDESQCAKASMDLTTCMGKILCPLQYETMKQAIQADTSSSADVGSDATIVAALEAINNCIMVKSEQNAKLKGSLSLSR